MTFFNGGSNINKELESKPNKIPDALQCKLENNMEYVENNFNTKSTINDETEILILGTITSQKGMKNGYFYTSNKNTLYEILDNVYNSNDFSSFKKKIIEEKDEKDKLIKEMREALKKKKIAFIDVIQNCVRHKSKASDDAIWAYNPIDLDKLIEYINYKGIKNKKKIFYNSDWIIEILRGIIKNNNEGIKIEIEGSKKEGYKLKYKENEYIENEYILIKLSSPSRNNKVDKDEKIKQWIEALLPNTKI